MTPRDPVSRILAEHDAEVEYLAIRREVMADEDEYTPSDDDRAVAILAAGILEVTA